MVDRTNVLLLVFIVYHPIRNGGMVPRVRKALKLMNLIRRTLVAGTLVSLAVGVASADTIMTESGTSSTFGNLSTITVPNSGTITAGQFDQVGTNAAIQAACPVGDTCSALTLTEIDFTLTTNLSASVSVANSTGTTAYIGSIGGENGLFGSPTSGFAVAQDTTVTLSDPLTASLLENFPTFSEATTTELVKTNCGAGTANAGNFENCLAVAAGGQTFSGTGTDTQTAVYLSGAITSPVLSTYVGTGNVSFGVATSGGTSNGTLQAGVTIPTNSATVTSLVDALQVTYDYTYTEDIPSGSAPEPTTMVLLGGALLGIGFFRNKRRAD